MKTPSFVYMMISMLQVLSFALQFFFKLDSSLHRLCLDINCSEIAFSSKIVGSCTNFSKIDASVDVCGVTSDAKYYLVLLDDYYYIPESCIETPPNSPVFRISSPIKEFKLFEYFITRNPDMMKYEETVHEEVNKNENKSQKEKDIDEKTKKQIIESPKIEIDYDETYVDEMTEQIKTSYNDYKSNYILNYPFYIIDKILMIWDPNILEKILNFTNLRSEQYYQVTIFVLLFIFIWRFFRRGKSLNYQIEKKQLEKLYLDRIKILEKIETDLKDRLDAKSKELTEITALFHNTKNNVSRKSSPRTSSGEIVNHIEIDGELIPESVSALKPRIMELSEKLKVLKNEKNTLEEFQFRIQDNLNKILTFIFNNEVFMSENIDESLKLLMNLSPDKVFQSISNINEKLNAFKSNDLPSIFSTEIKDIKEKYQNSLDTIAKLELDFKDANLRRYEIEIELKAFKSHYKEAENNLQEKLNQEKLKVLDLERRMESLNIDSARVPDLSKIIADLKFEISSLELKIKSEKDQYLLDLNQQYTLNKKIERELDRTKLEKEKYRSQLLKVLNDNQITENEKDHVSESNFTPKTIISSHRKSDYSVKSSYFKNDLNDFEPIMPPPPPPPMMFSAHQMVNQPFFPNETSSPRLEIPNLYVAFTNVPTIPPPFDVFSHEYQNQNFHSQNK